jgi:hypothetical protein
LAISREQEDMMREQFPPITINFAPVKVVGIPGLSLVAIAVAIAVEFPVGRWLLLSGLAGGILVAAALILVRRRQQTGRNGPDDGILMACGLPSTRQDGWLFRRRSANAPASPQAPSSKSPKTSWAYASREWPPVPSW